MIDCQVWRGTNKRTMKIFLCSDQSKQQKVFAEIRYQNIDLVQHLLVTFEDFLGLLTIIHFIVIFQAFGDLISLERFFLQQWHSDFT